MNRKNKFFGFLISIFVFSVLLLGWGKETVQAETMCTVKFNNILGTSTSKIYTNLNRVVPKDTVLVLPDIATSEGYVNLGWSIKKGDKSSYFKIGTKVRVVGNVTFYLVKSKIPTVTASFYSSSGASNSTYAKLTQKVYKGTSITLPSIKAANGYVILGWTTVKGKSTPLYKAGSKYTLSKNTSFYLVSKKAYNISFAGTDGVKTEEFLKLNQLAASGSTITLPDGPVKDGQAFAGWSVNKNSENAEYKAGSSYKVTKNTTFYAVYVSGVTLRFMNNDGSKQVGSTSVVKGTAAKLIGYYENGYTMMGWSAVPMQTLGAKYAVGQKLTLKKDLTLYAVLFDKKTEPNYDADTLPQVDTRKYTKVILVGDSRTSLMKENLEKEFSAPILKGMSFICKKGSGLSWLKTTGYTNLMNEIGNGGTAQKPIAVIFNSGVNDLLNISDYIKYMKDIAPILKEKHCKLFYMSVNPVNNVVLTNRGLNVPEERVRSFNSKIKTSLCSADGAYTYMDTYTELYQNGFGHDNGRGRDDGLHFTAQTYKRIYAFMVKTLNQR